MTDTELKSIRIPADAHQAAKIESAKAGKTMAEWIASLIRREAEKGGKDSRNK